MALQASALEHSTWKKFKSQGQYENHLRSKKYRALEKKAEEAAARGQEAGLVKVLSHAQFSTEIEMKP